MGGRRVLLDCGTSYTKIHDLDTGARGIIPSRELRNGMYGVEVAAATGHNELPRPARRVNELVALAEGGLALVGEGDFTVLDCGARDVKYVQFRDRKVVGMDWNAECGAFAGQVIELLVNYFALDTGSLPGTALKIPVVCGVLGMTRMFDMISDGESHEAAFMGFLKGIAYNCEVLVGKPEKIYLSGGLCENRAFLESFTCEAVPLGRYVLLDGLEKMTAGG